MAWKKDTKIISLIDSKQITTWRQVLNKENALMKPKTDKELKNMEGQLDKKNTYMHLFKSDRNLKRETVAAKTGKDIIFVYDQAKRDEEDRGGYDQKAKNESVWSKNRFFRDYPKEKQNTVLTSSQAIGWREPIDDMRTGFSRANVCKGFYDKGHL